MAEWENAIGQLNELAANAEKSLKVVIKDRIPRPDSHLQSLLKECERQGFLSNKNGKFTFTDEDSRFFINGGWLEIYINALLNALWTQGLLQDHSHINILIRSPRGTENELDIAFMAGNRLHIIECKTRRFRNNQAGDVGTESLYKLDSLSDLAGLGTKSMLVSYRKLEKRDRGRARDLKIKTVEYTALQKMKDILRDWIQSGL